MKDHNIVNRWKSTTPAYFKKIIYTGITVGSTCLGIRIGFEQAGIALPDWFNRMLEIGVAVGVIASVVAKTAVEDNNNKKEGYEKSGND